MNNQIVEMLQEQQCGLPHGGHNLPISISGQSSIDKNIVFISGGTVSVACFLTAGYVIG